MRPCGHPQVSLCTLISPAFACDVLPLSLSPSPRGASLILLLCIYYIFSFSLKYLSVPEGVGFPTQIVIKKTDEISASVAGGKTLTPGSAISKWLMLAYLQLNKALMSAISV